MVQVQRQVGDQVSVERRYYISSLDNDAQRFGEAVRSHWSIENSLHWVLDVVFREDDSRVRTGHAPENMALLRQMAVSLLQREKTAKVGVQTKRLKAGWDNTYLAKVLSAGYFLCDCLGPARSNMHDSPSADVGQLNGFSLVCLNRFRGSH